jgi:hypothetical protein
VSPDPWRFTQEETAGASSGSGLLDRCHMAAGIFAQIGGQALKGSQGERKISQSLISIKSPFAPRKGVLSRSGTLACAGCPDIETPLASTPATPNCNLVLNHAKP